MIALGEIADFIMGQAPPGKDCNSDGVGTPFVKAGEFTEKLPLICQWTTNPLKMAKAGDVLVCVVGATAGKICLGADCAIGRSVAAVRPKNSKLEQIYLFYFLQTHSKRLRGKSQGVAQGVITKEMLSSIEIPLPPLPEQKRIAAILDAADAMRAKRKEAIAQLDTLLQATFLDIFGDPVTNPKGWEQRELNQLCVCLSGYAWKATHFNSECAGNPVIRIQNVGTTSSDLVFTTEGPIERFWVSPGEYLLSLSGSFRLAPWNGPRALLNQRIVKLTPNTVVVPQYFEAELSTRLSAIEAMGRHALVNNVALSDLKRVKLRLPPLDLQRRFADVVDSVEKQKSRMQSHLTELGSLIASLQSRAFNGEL